MKKCILTTIALITICIVAVKAQQPKTDAVRDSGKRNSQLYEMENDKWGPVTRDKGIAIFAKQHYADSMTLRPQNTAVIGYYGSATLARLNSTREIELATSTITAQNADKYLYHVVLNDSIELVHWTKPTTFKSTKHTSYAYLGKFNCVNKIIRLEIYEINDYKNKVVIIFNSGYMPAPQIISVILNYNSKYLFNPDKQEYIPENKQHYYVNGEWHKKPISFRWSDDINHIAIQMKNTLQNDMYNVYLKRNIRGKTDSVLVTNNWEHNYYSADPIARINAAYFNKPGKYELIIKPATPDIFKLKDNGIAERIPFTVWPGPIYYSIRQILFATLAVIVLLSLIFIYYRNRQKRKLAIESQTRQIASLQLQSVRSQLNPHFMFNALAGIQNLMNKNEIDLANKYLARFARITRNVLDDGNKELTTIEREADLLNDYLQMEQMRFGFTFNIDVDDIDQQIEIPAMLLQPFVENAVKHGVSTLKDKGLITIGIAKKDNDLLLNVQDNGKGFSNDKTTGIGIKLCEERIKLLNSIYKNATILLRKNSFAGGTLITIELKNWL